MSRFTVGQVIYVPHTFTLLIRCMIEDNEWWYDAEEGYKEFNYPTPIQQPDSD